MRKKSFFNSIQRSFLLVVISITVISSLILSYYSFQEYQTKIKLIDNNYLKVNQNLLKHNIQSIKALADAKLLNIDEEIRNEVFYRVQEAISIAYEIYFNNYRSHDQKTVKYLIREALRGIRFNNGTSYYFINDFKNDTLVLQPTSPDLEGQGIEAFGEKGLALHEKLSSLIDTFGDGFHQYRWTKPEAIGNNHEKLTYVKLFEPYGWYIGTGLYLDEFEKAFQERIIDDVDAFYSINRNYILFNKDKTFLVGDMDSRAINFVLMEPGEFHRIGNTLYYSEEIKKFGWTIGVTADLSFINARIADELEQIKIKTISQLCLIILVAFLLSLLALLMIQKLNDRILNNFAAFSKTFQSGAETNQTIPETDVHYVELEELSKTANDMIDENRLIKEGLEASREMLAFVLNTVPSMIFTITSGGETTNLNNAATQFVNKYREREGNPLGTLLEKLQVTDELISHIIESREAFTEQAKIIEFDKQEMIFDVRTTPLRSLNGAVIQLEEITERIRLENMLVQTEKMMSVGGMAAGIAHEINNPLSIIGQATANLSRRISPTVPANREAAEDLRLDLEQMSRYLEKREIPQFLNDIQAAVKRASEIIKSMLSFSASTTSQREDCNIRQLIDETLVLAKNDYELKKKYHLKETKITLDIAEDLPAVFVNKIEIEQVLFNLIKNALQAMSTLERKELPPSLSIGVTSEAGWINISVIDNGSGMDERTRNRIFEPFYTTKGPGVGTGLGLSISYFIITKRHGGKFMVKSKIDEGTTFTIKLPLEKTE